MMTKHVPFLSGKRIILVGGGIAGLTFVAALNQQWDPSYEPPEVTIIERENREAAIEQDPYVLSINGGNQDGGLVAMQEMGLLDELCDCSALSSGIIRVWSDNWKQLATIDPKPYNGLPAALMRMTRQNLKRLLLKKAEFANAANFTTWRWSCSVMTAERLSNGRIQVTMRSNNPHDAGNTCTQDCDVLIAADGPESQVRTSFRLYDMGPTYTGAMQIGGIAQFPGGVPRPIHEDYGLQMSSGEGVMCIYTPFDAKTVGWWLSRMPGAERASKSGPVEVDFAAFKNEALATAHMFHDPFRTVVEATDPSTVFVRPAKERPRLSHTSSGAKVSELNVIYIGDANHLLSPFELKGADMALLDGWDLASSLVTSASMESALATFDKVSIARVGRVMGFSHTRIGFGHSRGLKWWGYKYGMALQRGFK